MSISWFSPSNPDSEPAPTKEDGNEYTTKRIEKANEIGRRLTKSYAELQAETNNIDEGFLKPDDKEAYTAELNNKKSQLQDKLKRVQSIRTKPVPSQPGPTERLRISDQDNDSFAYDAAKERLESVRQYALDVVENDRNQVVSNVRFNAKDGFRDKDPEDALYEITTVLEDQSWELTNPDYTEEQAANTVHAVHSLDDYELLTVAAGNKDIVIHERNRTPLLNILNKHFLGTTQESPREVLTEPDTIEQNIRQDEQRMHEHQSNPSSLFPEAREKYFKENLLDDGEREAYEQQGEWLPSTARQPRGNTSSPKAYEIKRRFQHTKTPTYHGPTRRELR